eukprot:51522_1
MNGIKCEPNIVFTSAFKHLQKIALEYINQITNNKQIQDNEIQWIFTVPAIWSEKAKYKMKTWLVTAGLIDENIQDNEIQWIFTVPAIWSEKAKYKMKTWLVTAGLIDENIQDQCLIVYESDCAALAMFEELRREKSTEKATFILN